MPTSIEHHPLATVKGKLAFFIFIWNAFGPQCPVLSYCDDWCFFLRTIPWPDTYLCKIQTQVREQQHKSEQRHLPLHLWN